MSKKKSNKVAEKSASAYTHEQEATQRPDVGVQPEFEARKSPVNYRYDSSLAPEMSWDENAERDMAEWLLNLVGEAADKGEAEVFAEPQVWKGSDERFNSTVACVARLKSLTQPFLNWTGKAERQQISVPTIPLFVHERHSTQAILETLESYKASGTTMDLFGDPELDITDKLDAYEHKGPWTNRMVLGDSLQVMNSLLEYEGMGGQVQMIYMDPPYGVKFGSNFQPFVRKREVKNGKDDDMVREPEMVKAYRDTWELGLHSFLTYLRDRFLVARELLTDSGSIFIQISDENVHHVKELMDEIFGSENLVSIICYQKAPYATSNTLPSVHDYICWYAKDKSVVKYQQMYKNKEELGSIDLYRHLMLSDGSHRPMTSEERASGVIPEGSKRYRLTSLVSQGASSKASPFEYEGKVYHPPKNSHWKTKVEGLKAVGKEGRLQTTKNSVQYRTFLDDFPVSIMHNIWTDTITGSFNSEKLYVVQTSPKVIERCMMMTSEPGDLVLDPTCGSGTTAYVAEKWGRRWITCDTSRVPLALSRQRLLTSTFPWYELKNPNSGPSAGFSYVRKQNRNGEEVGGLVPRITMGSIAKGDEPETITLVDRPEQNDSITRVCGPFAVEATVQPSGNMVDEESVNREVYADKNPRVFIDRMIEVLRLSKTLRLQDNRTLHFSSVQHLPAEDHEYLHAVATEESGDTKRIAIAFGPEDGAINSTDVFEAAREAYHLKFDALYIFGFAIQAKARQLIDEHKKMRIRCGYVAVTPDVVMSDLLKTSRSSEVFSVSGLPDVKFTQMKDKAANGDPLHQVELLGLDVFRP